MPRANNTRCTGDGESASELDSWGAVFVRPLDPFTADIALSPSHPRGSILIRTKIVKLLLDEGPGALLPLSGLLLLKSYMPAPGVLVPLHHDPSTVVQ